MAQSLFAVFFAVVSAGTALGLGALFPKFEHNEYVSVERAHPSTLVIIGYFVGGTAVGAGGLLLTHGNLAEATAEHVGSLAAYAAVVGAVAAGGYALAVRRFDRLTLDDV